MAELLHRYRQKRDFSVTPEPQGQAEVRISYPERVIDKSTGLTKQDLVNHYLLAAKNMLPHLAKWPLALLRAPSGVDGPLFFQKHAQTLKIPDITLLDATLDPGHPPMIAIDSSH